MPTFDCIHNTTAHQCAWLPSYPIPQIRAKSRTKRLPANCSKVSGGTKRARWTQPCPHLLPTPAQAPTPARATEPSSTTERPVGHHETKSRRFPRFASPPPKGPNKSLATRHWCCLQQRRPTPEPRGRSPSLFKRGLLVCFTPGRAAPSPALLHQE